MQNCLNRHLINRKKVAEILGHSESWFRANYIELQVKGFPKPIQNCGYRWDPKAIEIWLDLQLDSKFQINDNFIKQKWEQELIARAQNM